MELKLFELRDRGTLVPAVAIKLDPIKANAAERWLLRRAGYGPLQTGYMLAGLEGGQIEYDPYKWGGNGTRHTAHIYLEHNWDKLKSGDVICTEHIRGERPEPKISERHLALSDSHLQNDSE